MIFHPGQLIFLSLARMDQWLKILNGKTVTSVYLLYPVPVRIAYGDVRIILEVVLPLLLQAAVPVGSPGPPSSHPPLQVEPTQPQLPPVSAMYGNSQ